MSDYRAIAAMTETLRNMLQDAVQIEFPGARVETNRPQKDPPDPRHGLINIFLYLVEPNSAWRNMELPVRASDGTLLRPPRAAVDLHYLISFYGSETQQIPQLLLGKTLATLHKQPYPSPRFLPREPPQGEVAPVERYLRVWESGLDGQLAQVQFVPLTLSHEELSKLWTIFFQTPYVLSLAYRCSVLFIEPELDEVPQSALPVRELRLHDATTELPEVDQVLPQIVELRGGTRLMLRGRNLETINQVQVSGKTATLLSTTASSALIDLPPGLAAGVNLVQAFRLLQLGTPPQPHRVYASSPVSFVLRPRLLGPAAYDPASGTVRVTLEPAVIQGQRVALLLHRIQDGEDAPHSYSLPALAPVAGSTLSFSARGVEAGNYLLRVEVDGVSTALETDSEPTSPTFDRYIAPTVSIPSPRGTSTGAASTGGASSGVASTGAGA